MYARDQVMPIAEGLIELFGPACERVVIAGSLRRGRAQVKDMEIVAIPKLKADMFGMARIDKSTQLDAVLADLCAQERLCQGAKMGRRYKQLIVRPLGIQLDLFCVLPPAQFGVQLLIRTGPAAFSKRFVTPRKWGGMLPSHLRVKDGAIWDKGQALETPTEVEVFEVLGMDWIEPKERE